MDLGLRWGFLFSADFQNFCAVAETVISTGRENISLPQINVGIKSTEHQCACVLVL